MSLNTKLCASLVRACINDDFEAMLTHFPEGVEHRAMAYLTPVDFELAGSYDEDARYNYPARNKMKEKVLSFVVECLEYE